jgi:aldose 1-epimerase
MQLNEEHWGQYEGKDVRIFTAKDSKIGFFATFTDLGAGSLRIVVPDKHGVPGDVTVTQETPDVLVKFGAYLGATCGRVANRIANGKFSLEGKEYTLFVNNGPNHLHGGKIGFDKKIWHLESKSVNEHEATLKFTLESADLEEGYPGKLNVSTKYTIQPNKITWEFEATTDKTTLVNITNHNYWNMDGIGVAINDQEIQIAASTYNPVDALGLNTGEIKPAENIGTQKPIKFSEIFATYGDVDNNYYLEAAKPWTKNQRQLHACAQVYSPATGREVTIRTSEPCVQLYTANYLGVNEIKTSNGDKPARKHFAFCLETQRPSNAIHQPSVKDSVILHPGETYFHKTEHEFRVR